MMTAVSCSDIVADCFLDVVFQHVAYDQHMELGSELLPFSSFFFSVSLVASCMAQA